MTARKSREREIQWAVVEALGADRRLPEESGLDHAKRLGLLGERRGGGPLFGCTHCSDLPWRRLETGCRGCGKAFEPERVERPEFGAVSNAYALDGSMGIGPIGITHGETYEKNRKRRGKAA